MPMAAMVPGNLAAGASCNRALAASRSRPRSPRRSPSPRDGFPLLEFNAASINQASGQLRDMPFFAEWNRVYAGGAGGVRRGDVLRQPDLARTYQAISADGPGHLYGGPLGRAMVAHLQSLGGCIVEADLHAPITRWSDPISARYRDLLVHTPPPASQSFQYLLALRILDGFEISSLERNGVEHLDLLWRAIRLSAGARIRNDNPDPERLLWLLSEPRMSTSCAPVPRIACRWTGLPSSGLRLCRSASISSTPPRCRLPTPMATWSA